MLSSFVASSSLFESGGLLFGYAYLWLTYNKSNMSWICGIISAICIIVVDITETHLYCDAIFHIFFLMMSIGGLYFWTQGSKVNKEIRISKMPLLSYLGYLFISLVISGAAGYLLATQTDAAYPYLDSFQMTLSIFATFLIIYCVVNAWSYWIIVHILSIILYVLTGAYLLALLYLGYIIYGAMKWQQWISKYAVQRKPKQWTS